MSNNLTVRDKMIGLEKFPVLEHDVTLKKALDIMTKDRIGVACFVDASKHLVGVTRARFWKLKSNNSESNGTFKFSP